MTTTNNKMEHVLYIPDYVIPGDEDTIIQFFHNFEIAKVEKVEIYEHRESEYNAAWTNERPELYCNAIIFIKEWYDTKVAENFYNNILERKAKIVHNDPEYWDVEFCDPRLYYISDIIDDVECIYEDISDVDKCIEFLSDKYTQYTGEHKHLPSSGFVNNNEEEQKKRRKRL